MFKVNKKDTRTTSKGSDTLKNHVANGQDFSSVTNNFDIVLVSFC